MLLINLPKPSFWATLGEELDAYEDHHAARPISALMSEVPVLDVGSVQRV